MDFAQLRMEARMNRQSSNALLLLGFFASLLFGGRSLHATGSSEGLLVPATQKTSADQVAWNRVIALPEGTEVEVMTRTAADLTSHFMRGDDAGIVIKDGQRERTFARGAITAIRAKVKPAKNVAMGLGIGAAAGFGAAYAALLAPCGAHFEGICSSGVKTLVGAGATGGGTALGYAASSTVVIVYP
jgi:hypothetical protein